MLSKAEHVLVAQETEHEIDWEQLFQREFPRICNFLRYRTTNDDVAEELAAETFARAWASREQYRADLAAFSTWLFTIARNLAIDHLRQNPPQIALRDAPDLAEDVNIQEVIQRRENARRLAELIATLPAREAEIIALRYGADIPFRQIAKIMKISSVNVRVILFRTLRKLRAQWEE